MSWQLVLRASPDEKQGPPGHISNPLRNAGVEVELVGGKLEHEDGRCERPAGDRVDRSGRGVAGVNWPSFSIGVDVWMAIPSNGNWANAGEAAV